MSGRTEFEEIATIRKLTVYLCERGGLQAHLHADLHQDVPWRSQFVGFRPLTQGYGKHSAAATIIDAVFKVTGVHRLEDVAGKSVRLWFDKQTRVSEFGSHIPTIEAIGDIAGNFEIGKDELFPWVSS